ncbi:FAD-dependent oxidoreductase [Klebsiella pneumoniae]|uniref:FAD-dependent oxidoreductase n=1 Tax=Klebsiella pneumoniae TaxID=573 RepID=UPI003970E0D6
MRQHGVNFQPPLSGALHVARTNAFFMGGGKALVNAYYRSAEQMGVQIRYNTPVQALELRNGEFVAALAGEERIVAKSCVLAAGGFESNREWLREAWGKMTAVNGPPITFSSAAPASTGVLLKFMIDAGADIIGDPRSPTASPLTPGRRSTMAGSVPASTACRWG